ncbi:MAG: transporter substrate-binding domain-containing protein, partial [Chloroflexi bacterium]|nr:transporter substrate-binding domain-containing protein [Chloroflexota bacterium]
MRHLSSSGMAILRCVILFGAALLTTGALISPPTDAPTPKHLLSPDNSLPTDSPNSKPTYIVGGDSDYPPYEYLENGQPQGFNVELIQAVGEVMGFDVTIRLGPWSEVRQQLENGEIDIISGMYYSPERDQRVDFSTPHTLVSSGLFVRSGSPIHSLEDIRGKAVIVQRGDFMHDYLLSEKLTDNIIAVDDPTQALNLLSSGKYDCALLSSKVQGIFLMSSLGLTNLNALETRLPQEEYAFAVTEGNSQLLYQLNEGLSILKNNGRYKQIYNKWFGVYEQSMLGKSLKYIGLFVGVLVLLLVVSALWSWSLRDQVKHQTKQLQKSEERFRALYEQAPIAFHSLNDKGEILEVNPVWLQMMGYRRGEVINHSFEEFMTPEYSEL